MRPRPQRLQLTLLAGVFIGDLNFALAYRKLLILVPSIGLAVDGNGAVPFTANGRGAKYL